MSACELAADCNFDLKPGVDADMGDGDQWPGLREQILAADIVVLCSPTWMGHKSSIAQRVLERLDAELSETDDAGRPILGTQRRTPRDAAEGTPLPGTLIHAARPASQLSLVSPKPSGNFAVRYAAEAR
ncbi:hypothetical protein DC31_00435 [Microbacterium sp. CH12i]|uniref:hypothetical protein n=1 Tax=Microbacterium sp. CH12i TaxID=1479651 RepID=UPI000461ADA5|nr:hypothetical protein DC31_00435 [Microbacterium sp. CH12i]